MPYEKTIDMAPALHPGMNAFISSDGSCYSWEADLAKGTPPLTVAQTVRSKLEPCEPNSKDCMQQIKAKQTICYAPAVPAVPLEDGVDDPNTGKKKRNFEQTFDISTSTTQRGQFQ